MGQYKEGHSSILFHFRAINIKGGGFLMAHFQIQEDDIEEHEDGLNRRRYRNLSTE